MCYYCLQYHWNKSRKKDKVLIQTYTINANIADKNDLEFGKDVKFIQWDNR